MPSGGISWKQCWRTLAQTRMTSWLLGFSCLRFQPEQSFALAPGVQRLGRSGHRTSSCTMPRRKCLKRNLQPVKRIASWFGNAADCFLVPNELRPPRRFAADILLNNVNGASANSHPHGHRVFIGGRKPEARGHSPLSPRD
jgi:hypothetical protein